MRNDRWTKRQLEDWRNRQLAGLNKKLADAGMKFDPDTGVFTMPDGTEVSAATFASAESMLAAGASQSDIDAIFKSKQDLANKLKKEKQSSYIMYWYGKSHIFFLISQKSVKSSTKIPAFSQS